MSTLFQKWLELMKNCQISFGLPQSKECLVLLYYVFFCQCEPKGLNGDNVLWCKKKKEKNILKYNP